MLGLGIIGNKELVAEFGNDKNKIYYNKTKKVSNSIKNKLLKKAYKNYDIVNIGNGKYRVDKIYEEDRIETKSYNRRYEHIQYNVNNDNDRERGVYIITLGKDIYIGSTISIWI